MTASRPTRPWPSPPAASPSARSTPTTSGDLAALVILSEEFCGEAVEIVGSGEGANGEDRTVSAVVNVVCDGTDGGQGGVGGGDGDHRRRHRR